MTPDDDDAPRADALVVPAALAGARADRCVAELLDLGVNAARRLLAAGRVRVGGRHAKKGDAVHAGAVVAVEGGGTWLVPSPQPFDTLLVDAHVIVVDKPAGIPAHPLVPGEGGTVVDALVASYPEIAAASPDAREGGLVHRLDTGTSGCLAVARDRATWTALRAAFAGQGRGLAPEADGVFKRYLALVEGAVPDRVVVEGALVHDTADRRRMRAAGAGEAGHPARTVALALASGASGSSGGHGGARVTTLVEVEALGGRRHQVRAHLAAAGHPLIGDVLYGGAPAADAPWHLLHASALGLPGRAVIRAPVPAAFRAAAALRGLVHAW